MKELNLQEVLRYCLSGAIWIGSLLLMYPDIACSVWPIKGVSEVTLVLGAILVVGTLIYNLHRALLYPVIFRLIGLITLRKGWSWWLLFPWRPSNEEIEFDLERWQLKPEQRRPLDEWGAQVHFIYCAAWASLSAYIIGSYIAGPPTNRAKCIRWILVITTLTAGALSNFRLLTYAIGHISKLRESPTPAAATSPSPDAATSAHTRPHADRVSP